MERKTKIITLIALVALLVITLTATFNLNGHSISEEETIKIGYIGPLTGNVAIYGETEKNPVDLAVSEINSQGGINNKKIEILYEDGQCTGEGAATAAQKLINIDKVKILLVTCSSENMATAPLSEKNKVLQIAAWANVPELTYAGDYIFRTGVSDELTGKIAAETIFKKHKSLGIITEQTSYAQGISSSLKKHFISLNPNNKITEETYPQNSKDVRSQITKILSENPEAIFVNPDTLNIGITILRTLAELNYQGQLYGNFFGGSEQIQSLDEAQEMIFFADPEIEENTIKTQFLENYKKIYGSAPPFEYPALSRYDHIYLLKQSIEAVGEDPTNLKNYLYDMESFTGTLGIYSFDENGDIVGVVPSVKQIKNKEAIIYKV